MIKYSVLLTACDVIESTFLLEVFDTEKEAEEFVLNYEMDSTDVRLTIIRSRENI